MFILNTGSKNRAFEPLQSEELKASQVRPERPPARTLSATIENEPRGLTGEEPDPCCSGPSQTHGKIADDHLQVIATERTFRLDKIVECDLDDPASVLSALAGCSAAWERRVPT